MGVMRYSAWDGTQDPFSPDAGEILEELSDDLMSDSNLERVFQKLLQRGMPAPGGRRLDGYRDLLDRLRQRRKEITEKYDLNTILNDIQEKLEDIVDTERAGIERRLEEGRKRAELDQSQQSLQNTLEKMAAKRRETLDSLPPEPAGQIKELSGYDFMDAEARRKFQDLLEELKERAMRQYVKDLQGALKGMGPEHMKAVREMLRDLNSMLQQRMDGKGTDQAFQQFMQKHGPTFGPNPPRSLDELLERIQQQMAQAQSLLESLPQETRQQLEDLVNSLIDRETMQELERMAGLLDYLQPMTVNSYPFSGQDEVSLEQAMRLMSELQRMERLEAQLKGIRGPEDLDKVDIGALEELLGKEARRSWEEMKDLLRRLEEAGYIRRNGDKLELTPAGIRRIGQKAVRDIFQRLKKDRMGSHDTRHRGAGGEHTGETTPWQFGDDFSIDLQRSLMNTVIREGSGTPLRMSPADFEVRRTEQVTQAATCLLLDRSRSMGYYGSWAAAKKVAIALHTLIRSQYPRDVLYVIGFSDAALRFRDEDLAQLNWDTQVSGTNMHHAFMMSRNLLSKHKGTTRQIIMITDGEPTAHLEKGTPYFSYPPSHRTITETLMEARRCSQDGITINTFMLENNNQLLEFVSLITRVNGGRAFYSTPERLGEYVLVDYLSGRRKRVV